jgi:hypothetical protein
MEVTADQRHVATILEAVNDAFESNEIHDHIAVWTSLATIRVAAEFLARPQHPADDTLDLGDVTHGAEQ